VSEYPTRYLADNAVEQDPEDWWNAVCLSIRTLFEQSKDRINRTRAIGVSAQAPTLLLAVDQSGVPVRPALIWMDRRSGQQSQNLSERFGFDAIVQRTGNRPDPFFVASKLRWMSENEASLIKRSRWFLQINIFINHRLTGEFTLDTVHRSLLQLHDQSSNGWCDDILEWCGVESDLFPVASAGSEVIGTGRSCGVIDLLCAEFLGEFDRAGRVGGVSIGSDLIGEVLRDRGAADDNLD
jgi:xylulokinase